MSQHEIARLDEDGVITAIETVPEADHRTDPVARTVRLDAGHDMRNRLRGYKWNFNRQQFEPLSTEVMDVADRDTPELVESLIEVVEDLVEYVESADKHADDPSRQRKKFKGPKRLDRVLKDYRRKRPRKDKAASE